MTRPLHAAGRQVDELYADYGRMVSAICRALLRDPHEAEDAAQQTFLSAHRSLLGGAVPQDEEAWLATIARNECRARIRRLMATPLPLDDELAAGGDDVVELASTRADLAELTHALAQLPERQREAVVLRDFYGLSYDEVSVAMSSSPPAVESLLSRARSQLRRVPALARGAVGFGASLREAVERLVNALAPASTEAALAKLGAVAAVTVAATAVALEPVIDRGESAPTRRQPASPGEVRAQTAPAARPSAGATAPTRIARPAAVQPSSDVQRRRPRPARAERVRPARPRGSTGSPGGPAVAAPAAPPPARPAAPPPPPVAPPKAAAPPPPPAPVAPPPPPAAPTPAAPPPPAAPTPTSDGDSSGSGSGSSGSGDSGSGSSGSGESGSSGSGSSGSGSGSSGSGSSGSGSSGSGSGSSGSGSGDSSGSGSSGSGSGDSSGSGSSGSGSGDVDSSGSGSSGSGSGDDDGSSGSGSDSSGSGSGSGSGGGDDD